ncbi:MAG: FMN-binding protein [Clostridia bacterium]|nr:FMN-binding protein [Clostridia bacterium]
MIKNLKSVIALTLICAVTSILLALTNSLTAPIIKEQESAAVNDALAVVLPGGEGFEAVDISGLELPKTITEAYKERNGGYVLKMTTTGYGNNFVILCGIDKDSTVKGAAAISSNETLGVEETYGENFKDKKIEDVEAVDTVANATKTTAAYKGAIKDALNAVTILQGGSVDIRTEEEILKDNLSAALPEGKGDFAPVFLTEEIEGVDAIYGAQNRTGFVCVIGESFIATDKDGNVLTDVEASVKKTVEKAVKTAFNSYSSLTMIDLSKYSDIPSQVKEVTKTKSGNYVFKLNAAGFGINGDAYYNPSGEPIVIQVSATKDGKIIDCVTLSQKETDGIGSACADKKFYSQFKDKTEENYSDIDAISGATITTNGYKTAISKVFTTIKILEGVS